MGIASPRMCGVIAAGRENMQNPSIARKNQLKTWEEEKCNLLDILRKKVTSGYGEEKITSGIGAEEHGATSYRGGDEI